MLAVEAGLGVLDTIGIRETPKKILRTRFTEDEIQRLDLKQGKYNYTYKLASIVLAAHNERLFNIYKKGRPVLCLSTRHETVY